jgi:hypothetical protein
VCLCVITVCDVSLLGFWFGAVGSFLLSLSLSLFLSPGVIGHVVGKLFSVCLLLFVLGVFFSFALALSCILGSRSIENCGWCFLGSRMMAGIEDNNCRLQMFTYLLH